MIEVAVAMIMFGVLISAIATTQSSTMNLIRTDRHRSVAANLAAQEMDTVRATAFTALPGQPRLPVDGISTRSPGTECARRRELRRLRRARGCDAQMQASTSTCPGYVGVKRRRPHDHHAAGRTYDETTGHIG
jgi:type II secretory pathway pseudopilin PulG